MISALMLVVLGIIMIYSSSAVIAMQRYGNPFYFLRNQIIWVAIGIIGMLIAKKLDYKILKRLSLPLIIFSVILLILVLIPGIGTEVNGSRRWFRFIGLSFQPSELAKLTLIISISAYIAKRAGRMDDFVYGFFPPVVLLGAFQILIMLQPDMGTAIALGVMVLTLLFISGVKVPHILSLGVVLVPFIIKFAFNVGYRRRRILAFLDPWSDPTGAGFQVVQSFLALGSGGLLGVGLGQGKQKLFFLPEPHTDFIYSLIGEELGFLGCGAVILFFLVIIWRGTRIALRTDDPFGRYLAMGITLMIGIQALINLGVVTGMLPTKGLPLPFVSFGGSSLLINMVALGILLNISKRINPKSIIKKGQGGTVRL
jgi:cell division protein FtsW